MIRKAMATTALAAGLLTCLVSRAQAGPATVQAAAQAAPFIGEWTLNLEGPNGPAVFDLTVRTEADKVVGEMKNEQMAPTPITDITRTDKNLVLKYSFDYQGNQVGAVATLTPGADGKTNAQIDFADGAYVVTGAAVRKEKEKGNQ